METRKGGKIILFSIKSSKFSDCLSCELLQAPSCILETNCPEDLSRVDIVIVAECPAKNEIKEERPLVGKSGKTFRKYFDKYLKNNCKWLITNIVLCEVVDENGKASNPSESVINNCKGNLLNIIEVCKPKLILTMGASPLKAFDFKKFKITDIRGQLLKWNGFNILPTLHPSYVNRKKYIPVVEENFEGDFVKAGKLIGVIESQNDEIYVDKNLPKGIQYYSIPSKYYTDQYRLVDVQYSNSKDKVLYIFRDKNNVKEYYWVDNNYYCYQTDKNTDNRLIVLYSSLNQINVEYKERTRLESKITYEGDIHIDNKHVIDYSIKNKGDAPDKDLNIFYFDIETNTGGSKEFPNATEAKYPVCLITSRYHGQTTTYVLNNGTEINDREDVIIKSFESEKEMFVEIFSDLHKANPDIVTGWNVINFDLCYIFNRLPKLELDQKIMSPFEDVYIDGPKEYASIVGYIIVDMCELYKGFQLIKRENNKLGTIALIELGETKLQLEESYSTIYQNDLNKYIDYNIVDVELLERIEKKTNYIKLLNELRKICSGTFRGCRKTFGRLDCLMIKYLKEKGLASRNSLDKDKEEFPGAYVKDPIVGLHNWIVDFDFTSLYPSLILTYNIGVNTFLMKFEDMTHGYDFTYDKDSLPDKFNMIVDPLFKNEKIEYTKEQLLKEFEEKNLICTINGCFYKPHGKELSFYSEVLEHLLSSRKVFKNKMFEAKRNKDLENTEFFDIRQKTFKILANALYGVLGQNVFRFFNIDLASSVTLSGQEAIKSSILNADKFIENLRKKTDVIPREYVQRKHIYSDEMNIDTPYVITGDTDSLFATFEKMIPGNRNKDDAFKQITEWCQDVSQYLNKDIIIDMIQKHNVPINNNRLELKNELMCDRGLFISKKHYALSVACQEGTKVDERVIMGLEIKRRDFSSYTKKCLSELIDLILKSEKISFKKINNFIRDEQSEFFDKFKAGDKTVAKPINFTKKLEEYKAYESGKRFPESIESMQNWNMLMYNTFVPGVGGYLFKLSGIDMDKAPKELIERYNKFFLETGRKLTAISVPDEELRLPDYFIVDMKESLRFAWEDRWSQLLNPIMEMNKRVLTF